LIKDVLREFNIEEIVYFDCRLGLNNRQVLSYPSLSDLEILAQGNKSYPTDIDIVWTYQYPMKWKDLIFNLPFKISIEFSINPRKDIGTMAFAIAPQQYIDLNIKGPEKILPALNEKLDEAIRATWIPFWWRYPKKALQLFEPYIGFAIYGACISTVLFSLNRYKEIKEIFGESEQQQRAEILASREKKQKEFDQFEKKKQEVLNIIKNTTHAEEKIDIFASYILRPSDPLEFTPIDELFKHDSILPLIGFMFACFVVAGLLHIAFIELYKKLTPPSIIAIGRLARAPIRLGRIYDGLGWSMILAILRILGKFVYGFFQ